MEESTYDDLKWKILKYILLFYLPTRHEPVLGFKLENQTHNILFSFVDIINLVFTKNQDALDVKKKI